MNVVHTVRDLRAALAGAGQSAFVPTMGNLHAGHIDLVHQAKRLGRPVVASIFVNPLQFGQGEDFSHYPRTLAADCGHLEAAGCDLVFAPDVEAMYPEPQTFSIEPPLANELCGAFRPGHFAGVCTVVMKLFNMVQPRHAIFGKKDFQQLFLLRRMAQQFNLPIQIHAGETVRAEDGLALSSRNSYLTPEERREAPRLFTELRRAATALGNRTSEYALLEQMARHALEKNGWQVDYISIRGQHTLLTPDPDEADLVVLGAARLGKTRLIDNITLTR